MASKRINLIFLVHLDINKNNYEIMEYLDISKKNIKKCSFIHCLSLLSNTNLEKLTIDASNDLNHSFDSFVSNSSLYLTQKYQSQNIKNITNQIINIIDKIR